ncbi:SH3 domain-containing protein [Mesorhizobium sp. IMUNJ 23232]|uniref:SH3 domain-containing protein n=1 Tax=Mesorhizobium sp. IMUNJ 23232 TaxID=3376064 RepID=UPI0037911430
MKGWFGSGKSRARRTSLDFRYDVRPSIWHRIAERSHLIVAGVGSVAMLGMAGTAIWLALPSDSAEQIVSRVEAAPRVTPASAASMPAQQAETEQPSQPAAEVKPVDGPKPTASTAAIEIASSAPPPASSTTSIPEPMQIEPLDPTDPRWISATAGHAAATATATVPPAASSSASEPASVASAYAEDEEGADNAATAAIPAAKPAQDAGQPDKAVEQPAAEKKVASAGRPGRTARSVTMRAKPDDRGGVLGTVPGRADVQVVSCASWCEIVYKGKRGFVYRKFLRNNGR